MKFYKAVFSLPICVGIVFSYSTSVFADRSREGVERFERFERWDCTASLSSSDSVISVAETGVAQESVAAGGTKFRFEEVNATFLGQGWRDPSGLIWFPRSRMFLDHKDAEYYCKASGGRLPTVREWQQLGVYMGATRDSQGSYRHEGYLPQLLPNLNGHWFWSSEPYSFNGETGEIRREAIEGSSRIKVRCVGRVVTKSLVTTE
jgi:hypothetical protein